MVQSITEVISRSILVHSTVIVVKKAIQFPLSSSVIMVIITTTIVVEVFITIKAVVIN